MRKKVVCIGGGTGTYTTLLGLKNYPNLDLSVIISMTDSGGSNRVIRDEFGLLPTSDIRQCIVALSSDNSDEILRNLFTYRYSQGTGLTGMTFGNLFMLALTEIYGSQEKAIKKTCEMLRVKGNIIPVTYDNSHLVASYENGEQVLGEHYIDEPKDELGKMHITNLEIIPKAKANPQAIKAIKEADLIVLGPGDLYTSIICNLVIDGISKAIKNSKAKKVYVMNLMTKFGQTYGFSAKDHIDTLEQYLGGNSIDYCLINKTTEFQKDLLKLYKKENAFPVKNNLRSTKNLKVIHTNISSDVIFQKHKGDKLKRSLIRHDSKKLAKALVKLIY